MSAAAGETKAIDHFTEPFGPGAWTFSNGPEFPGAIGSLSEAPGYDHSGARLNFDTTRGGNYVSATFPLPKPISAEALSLWVRNPRGIGVQLRVQDSSGQTLHYSPNRPFEATEVEQWYRLIVKLGATDLHWGGRNDGVVHQPIASISVIAKPVLPEAGFVDFDEVDAINGLELVVDPVAKAMETGVSDVRGAAGVEIEHREANVPELDLAHSLGFRWIRTEMFWADVETQVGVYDFSWYDRLQENLAKQGMRAVFILCYGNPVYTGVDWFQPPQTNTAMQAFARFGREAAAHFAGQGARFEVWNEPENPIFWKTPNAAAYGALARAAIPQVHKGDPNAKVLAGGLSRVSPGFLPEVVRSGGTAEADAIALHPYRPEAPEMLADEIAGVRLRLALLFAPRRPPPIWTTEAGYSSAWYGDGQAAANRMRQAKYGTRQMLTAAGLGIPFQVVFALHDHSKNFDDPEQNFGIVDNGYQPKPLAAAIRTLLSQCRQKKLLGNLPAPESSLHILKFSGVAGIMLAAWSDAAGKDGEQVLFKGRPTVVLDYLGKPIAIPAAVHGMTALRLGDAPIYVSFVTLP